MSRVSIAGARRVREDVIGTIHDLNLIDLSEYDGSWEGFEPGDPIEGADDSAEKLVTARSLRTILDVDEEADAGPARIVDSEDAAEELEDVRGRVNDLEDRRDELEAERGATDERLETIEALAALGIDLDLLGGYDTLFTRVGEGNPEAVGRALEGSEDVEAFETFTGEDDWVVAVFARPAGGSEDGNGNGDGDDAGEEGGDQDPLEDALVGVEFAPIEVPDAEGSPEEYAAELGDRREELDERIAEIDADLREIREESGGFLLAAEEFLAIDTQRREVPLSFATTENAFVAEGWIPTERFVDLAEALEQSVGDHVEIDELERASYDDDGGVRDRQPVEGGAGEAGEPTAVTDGGTARRGPDDRESTDRTAATAEPDEKGELRADGGEREERPMAGAPPVVQDNPDSVRPFETLVRVINRPTYSEFDPSFLVFLTFPLFFGFMIGDLGYGLIYFGVGYLIYSRYDGALGALGAIATWAGGFTILFGILYGEILGLHTITEVLWIGALGMEHAPIEKGLEPAGIEYAQLWLVLSMIAGLVHVTAGYALGFVKGLQHGLRDAVLESGSWLVLMLGVWVWVFSRSAAGSKPDFVFAVFDGEPFALGFAGFSATIGIGAIVVAAIGLTLMIVGEIDHLGTGPGLIAGTLESLNVLVNILSYTRLAAVLLAKAGMAFVVNLLFFGAYQDPDGAFHFLIDHGPQYGAEHGTVLFSGLVHAGIGGILLGIVVFVVGHVLVLLLGITSAGLQAVRLEYVEFFQKFYEGGGEAYEPFGYDRRYTTEE
ncbi:V-type ATP synthase subunit I [Halobacteriales archaeon QH_8_64_26]|nr:MAG: V-type ATP synthase subunit I [Halobacteriales archaeon QH_8_64_26]